MKVITTLTILAICLYIVSAVTIHKDCTQEKFEQYKLKFNKKYATAQEHGQRFKNYCAALKRIDYLTKTQPKAQFGLTKFSDMTKDEFKRSTGMLFDTQVLAKSCLANGVTLPKLSTKNTPTSYDWRQHGVVNPVKDQGQCGSCWTFSTVGVIESAYAIKTGKLMSFSEQMLVDCSHGCANEPPYGSVCNQGCNGGWPWSAALDIEGWGGLVTETAYPYEGVTGQCQINFNGQHPPFYAPLTNYTCISSPNAANEDQMAAYLVEHGPISIGINAGYLDSYYGGIIDPWFASECDGSQLDHAIIIVGFGQEDSPVWGTTKYWIIRNSWGASWGESGYFRMVRGVNACGVANAVSAPIM